jgi:hypothetical protein
MNVFLIVTAGTTDLQSVANVGGEAPCRTYPGAVRALHESLLAPDGPGWVVDDSTEALRLGEFDERREIAPGAGDWVPDPEGRLRIIPAKLAGALHKLRQEGHTVAGALVLATHREGRPAEPIAVGPVLAAWLEHGHLDSTSFRADPPPGLDLIAPRKFTYFNFLREGNLEGATPEDQPVRREVVATIVEAIRAIARSPWAAGLQCVVSTVGGMPEVKPVAVEAARLAFGSERVGAVIEPRFRGETVLRDPNAALPAEALRVRVAVVRRLERYDMQGAADLCSLLERDARERQWTEPIRQFARWLASEGEALDSRPAWEGSRAFLAAARAECALRNGQFRDAVVATCTLADGIVLDAIETIPWVVDLRDEKGTFSAGGRSPVSQVRGVVIAEPLEAGRWKYNARTDAEVEAWLVHVAKETRNAILSLRDCIRRRENQPAPSDYRNAAIHGRLNPKDVESAKRLLLARGVWKGEPDGACSLLSARVSARALQAMGVPEPAAVLEAHILGLRDKVSSVV